jgi:HEPN domain-containing protein
MADRSPDWQTLARADLRQGDLSAANGHHEWACFAAHQAVEKALKGLHLSPGQQAWRHGLGRSPWACTADTAVATREWGVILICS